MNRFVIISGCSGGGKSTLLAELRRRGYAVVDEPGRRIVQAETRSGGRALPWIDMAAFLRRVIEMARQDYASAPAGADQWVFFDRGLVDAAAALEALTGEPLLPTLVHSGRYHRRVFLAPPWPDIYVQDQERRHDIAAALAEYERLNTVYPALGYDVCVLPKASVVARADAVMNALASDSRAPDF